MDDPQWLQLNVNLEDVKSRSEYLEVCKRVAPVEAKNVQQNEKCKHALGQTFVYKNHYDKPEGICSALHHVFQLYVFRASVGFPSWEADDPGVYRIHCPARVGTVWELRRSGAATAPQRKNPSEG